MIEEIELENWRSHGRSILQFKAGTNLLVGSMGAGKSSVLDAITFALFGTFPALERRKLKMENLVRERADVAKVRLRFQWQGNAYLIERTIAQDRRGVSGQASVYQGDRMLDHGPVAVTRYVEQLLGVDYDLFTRAIYSEQNNVDYFLTLDPRRRKQELDALLGLDKFETVRGNLVSVLHQVRNQRKTVEDGFDRAKLDQLNAREQEAEAQLQHLHDEQVRMERQAREQETQREGAEKEFLLLRKKKEAYDNARQEHARKESRWEHLRQELKETDGSQLAAARQRHVELEKERAQLAAQKKTLDVRAHATGQQKAQAEMQHKEIERKVQEQKQRQQAWTQTMQQRSLPQLQVDLQQAERQWIDSQSHDRTLAGELIELAKWQGALREGLTSCPLCEQPLADEARDHVQREKEARRKQKEAERAVIRQQIRELQQKLGDDKKRLAGAELLWKQLEEGKGWESELPRWKEKETVLQQEWDVLQAEKERIERAWEGKHKEYERNSWQIQEMERQLARKQEMERLAQELEKDKTVLEGLQIGDAELERVRKTLEDARVAQERLQIERKAMAQQQRALQENHGLLKEEIKRMETQSVEMVWLGQVEEQLTRYKNAVVETQTMLRTSLIGAINAALNEIWKIFYPYGNYRELRLRVDEKDYLFEVFEGQWKPLESIASGGERSCAALTLRVALAMVLTPNLSWLILDEPTHNLDKQAVELLSQTLQFKVPEVVKQSFVITHEEALMGSDFASSYKLGRDKENGGMTTVERI